MAMWTNSLVTDRPDAAEAAEPWRNWSLPNPDHYEWLHELLVCLVSVVSDMSNRPRANLDIRGACEVRQLLTAGLIRIVQGNFTARKAYTQTDCETFS